MLTAKNRSLSEQVVQQLFDAILQGELKPGVRLKEGLLARDLGVAQGTIREALQQLEHQGLVTKSSRRGTFVTMLSREDITNIYRVRMELEPLAASLARKNMQPEEYVQLESLLRKMEEASQTSDLVERCKLDLAFHQLIWALSGNPWLERALNAVCPPLFASFMIRAAKGETYDLAKDDDEHHTLLRVMQTGNGEDVTRVFRSMIKVFFSQDVCYFESNGKGSA